MDKGYLTDSHIINICQDLQHTVSDSLQSFLALSKSRGGAMFSVGINQGHFYLAGSV